MAQEIKSIREELDDLKSEMDSLNLRVCITDREPISHLVVERETISFVQTNTVIGRDSDKNNILEMLFDPKYAEENVTVIPIVGFGGFGKTTLAQLVFNDESVKEHFDLAKWACVPEINDQNQVLGKVMSALTGVSYQGLSTEEIQSKIRVAVKDKKFFLVMDDIWDESRDRWLVLLSLLQCDENTELVRLWMAQGYVGPLEERQNMEDVTDQYFLELLRRNFFQDVEEHYTEDVIHCKMHDLVHDLAQLVACDEINVVDGLGVEFSSRLMHVNFCAIEDSSEALESLLAAKNLRSLLLKKYNRTESTIEAVVLRFKSLRALDMYNSDIETVPDSINRLTHLRYLNLSCTHIKFLPNGITKLDNLKTLNLDYCRMLTELPEDFSKLVNLRHLGILGCPLSDMPPNFSRLKSLRELNRFIIGENNGLDTLKN